MSRLLGLQQPSNPVGYWLKPHAHADVACLIIREEKGLLLRAACGAQMAKQYAIQGNLGVRLCETCLGRIRARTAYLRRHNGR